MRKLVPSLRSRSAWAAMSLLSLLLVVWVVSVSRAIEESDPTSALPQAKRLMQDGNYAEASVLFRAVIKNPDAADKQVVESLEALLQCQQQLGLFSSLDNDLASALTAHPNSFRVLAQAANQIQNAQHYGVVADQQFVRGYARGQQNGQQVYVVEQDRLQALKWRTRAIELANNTDAAAKVDELAQLHLDQATALQIGRDRMFEWRLQSVTDLQQAPDYLDLDGQQGLPNRPAPVTAAGDPVLYDLPSSWQTANSDGQRLRWSLAQAELSENKREEAKFRWGAFLNQQFSVDTLQQDAWLFRQRSDTGKLPEQGVSAIHTLAETETIAKLANGIKRFSLPDEFNPIRIFQDVAKGKGQYAEAAAWQLIQISLNRRQYPQAAEQLQSYLARFDDSGNWKQKLLDSILRPRLTFDSVPSQLAGQPAKLSLLFRNATQVNFTARRVDIEKILLDTKTYYRKFRSGEANDRFGKIANEQVPDLTSPGSLFDADSIDQYLLEQVAEWDQPLDPRPNHWDRRIQIDTPLSKAGLYLIEGSVGSEAQPNAQIVRILVSIEDTALVQKAMGDGQWLLCASDADSGQPVAGANIEMFGFGWDRSQNNNGGRPKMITENFAARTDKDGMAKVAAKQELQWFSVVRTQQGRFALLGFQQFWSRGPNSLSYAELKAYGVSDRPMYRPGEAIQAKFWLGFATYGDEPGQRVANRKVTVNMLDPQGLQVAERQLTTDDYGGCELDVPLSDAAALGHYSFQLRLADAPNTFATTSLAIRVEEYRKPEFEVNILAPEKPVALGETFEARIEAKYYFGAPVTEAEVSVKVERSTYREDFYPWAPYDWCYGPGYWWFAEDYTWYPNWRGWGGCIAPLPSWRPFWGNEPPELVLEQQLELDSTGIAKLKIDTALAKAIYGDSDHKYSISVEVRDASRRTITASGSVIAAQEPFKVYAWVDRGFYTIGQRIDAHFQAQQLDGTPVGGGGTVELLKIKYDDKQRPEEQVVARFDAQTDAKGECTQTMQADQAGQYRVRMRLKDAIGHEIEGGYIFTVRGNDSGNNNDYRYNALELTPDKQHYTPGETVKLQIAADYPGARVAVFVRPAEDGYELPRWITLDGKSSVIEIPVTEADQPNFFVEAATVYGGKYHQQVRQIVVPPAERVLNVEVAMDKEEYLPGEECVVDVKVTDPAGKPVAGSCVIAAYDRSLEALAGDVLPPDIREFFWKWQRHHQPQRSTNLDSRHQPIQVADQPQLQPLGIFGSTLADDLDAIEGNDDYAAATHWNDAELGASGMMGGMMGGGMGGMMGGAAPMSMARGEMHAMSDSFASGAMMEKSAVAAPAGAEAGGGANAANEVSVRKDFADSALWLAKLDTDASGRAKTTFKMPENLTSWQLRTWTVASQTRVGSDATSAVTRKPLLIRLQTPRFLVERDEVVLSANVHNDLPGKRRVKVALEIDGETQLELLDPADREQSVDIDSHQQARVDWRCRATAEGTVTVRAIAVTDDASDAMQLEMPIVVNGILKMESLAGTVRSGQASSIATLTIPDARRIEQSRLVVRLSPSLAAAMIDALPYLAEYPYGCTEQTLNRFLPTVITQRVLQRMNVDLANLKEKRNNLNAQELGDAAVRRERWKRFDRTAVFDDQLVADMVQAGVTRLSDMQHGDGGWGWFSGIHDQSGAHTTATVVRGLLIAQQNDVPIVPDVLQRGLAWLEQHQQQELLKLQNADGKVKPYKEHPDNIDALVFHVLVLAERTNPAMQQILFDQREHLSTYGKALLAWATNKLGNTEQTNMLRRNMEQFLVEDAENETAFLRGQASWWYWYGSEIEANAIYLKLLAAIDPRGQTAPRVVKYLLNNRKHATYWNSTRDTALVVEAFADYIAASGEMQQTMRAEVFLSGKRLGTIQFTPANLFDVDNTIEIHGSAVPSGEQQLEIRRTGQGNLYWNAYATNFTLEEEIAPAGLEVKIERRYYHLQPSTKSLQLPDKQANVVDTQQAGFTRTLLEDLQAVPSGELVEVELLVESKNDYEYLLIEDPKAAGLESVETQSGYFYSSGLSIYRELRDRHVGLCIRWLPRGSYSIRYQLRSERPAHLPHSPVSSRACMHLSCGNSADFDMKVVE
ncbi:MAG: MG2 domain-containing protein [Pirellulaceae bacterium]